MALTKTLIRQRLQAILQDPGVSTTTKRWLNRILDEHRKLGRPLSQTDDRVEAFLSTSPNTMDEEDLRRAIGWVIFRWDDLPTN